MKWTIHTQGPDEPVFIIEAEGRGIFIARLDEECKTRAELMANGFLLAAAPELLIALDELINQGDLALYAGYVGRERIAKARAAINKAKEWSDYYGRPMHVGEFGCFTTADPESRANFYRSFREAAEKAGIGWAIWDWKAGFRYWDEKAGRPAPGMREALFGRQASRTIR